MRRFLAVLLMLPLALPPMLGQDNIETESKPRREVAADAPVSSVLNTIFSPARAPRRKTMGLLQRSFLDLADQVDQALELAVVVDGTDSMAEELAGVRE